MLKNFMSCRCRFVGEQFRIYFFTHETGEAVVVGVSLLSQMGE